MKESITPTMSRPLTPDKRRATITSSNNTPSAPTRAERRESNKATAAPSPAPALTPNSEGSANGLRKRVCITAPPTAKEAPANKAVRSWGKRWWSTMKLAVLSVAGCVSTCHTSATLTRTLPMSRLAKANSSTKATRKRKRIMTSRALRRKHDNNGRTKRSQEGVNLPQR